MHPDANFRLGARHDSTRRLRNDLPWRGKRVRTYKHYVVSPDPKDGIGLEALRELATTWAAEHSPEMQGRHRLPQRQRPRHPPCSRGREQHQHRDGQTPPRPGPQGARRVAAGYSGAPGALRAAGAGACRRGGTGPEAQSETPSRDISQRVRAPRRKGAHGARRVLLDSRHPRPRAHSPHRGEERGGVPKRALFHGRDRHGQLAPGAEARLDIRARRSSHQKDLRGAHGARLRARAP